jgi:hypothetical protein
MGWFTKKTTTEIMLVHQPEWVRNARAAALQASTAPPETTKAPRADLPPFIAAGADIASFDPQDGLSAREAIERMTDAVASNAISTGDKFDVIDAIRYATQDLPYKQRMRVVDEALIQSEYVSAQNGSVSYEDVARFEQEHRAWMAKHR